MKKFITLLTLTSILHAQETPAEPSPATPESPGESTGQTAFVATKSGQENNWQNWVFVGGALVVAGVAVLVVSLNSGSNAN